MLSHFDTEEFLEHYWQKQPLLIRQGIPGYQSPLTPEELAGLSCEDGIESRIIQQHQQVPYWTLKHGPFTEKDFSNLPEKDWTLLVQGINKLLPEVNDLVSYFRFLPSWRIDDVMASFAVDGGSVGPHTDQYDVFLLQGYGRRKWMIADAPGEEDEFIPGLEVKVLQKFAVKEEWILEPGDILYLPPGVPHHGTGIGDCMTYSIGFRAPSYAELISSFIDASIQHIPDNIRFRDPVISAGQHHGEITRESIEEVKDILKTSLLEQIDDDDHIDSWFGRFVTEYLGDEQLTVKSPVIPGQFKQKISSATSLYRPPETRASYIEKAAESILLFVNGEEFSFKPGLSLIIKLFCDKNTFNNSDLETILGNTDYTGFFYQMYQQGFIEIPEND